MSGQTNKQDFANFLQLFDGDVDEAVHALREYEVSLRNRPITQEPSSPILISIDNLVKTYRVGHQEVRALNGVSLNIHEGEFVAIMAPSGSGKSTLLQLMGGLEKPTSGTVTVSSLDINKLNDRKLSEFRGKTIGFVFQFFYLQPFLSLEHNLEVPGMFARTKQREFQERARELAQIVGIGDRLKHLPKELSGGQIQRAAVARALMNKPRVILADEPTGNLDTKNRAAIIDLFEQIRKEYGTTIVIATHDSTIADRADRVFKLQDGVLI